MPDQLTVIPDRAAFKASEVCEIAQIPPYVLRSWEKEFPGLGVTSKPGGPKVYRRGDVEQILRIKQLLFSEGLTLAGVRRKLEGEPAAEQEAPIELPVPEEVKAKVGLVKNELRSLLDLLGAPEKQAPIVSANHALDGGHGGQRLQLASVQAPPETPAEPAGWPPAPKGPPEALPALRGQGRSRPVTAEEPVNEPALPLLDTEAAEPAQPAAVAASKKGKRRK